PQFRRPTSSAAPTLARAPAARWRRAWPPRPPRPARRRSSSPWAWSLAALGSSRGRQRRSAAVPSWPCAAGRAARSWACLPPAATTLSTSLDAGPTIPASTKRPIWCAACSPRPACRQAGGTRPPPYDDTGGGGLLRYVQSTALPSRPGGRAEDDPVAQVQCALVWNAAGWAGPPAGSPACRAFDDALWQTAGVRGGQTCSSAPEAASAASAVSGSSHGRKGIRLRVGAAPLKRRQQQQQQQ
ncbi:MAG: hypothetical protein J3K34DRAFT_523695, partial [Monoraphidium minutum]